MKWFFCFFVIFSHLIFANENVASFLKKLPKEQVAALDWVFRRSMNSFSGYVLYGDKPMAIESYRKCQIDSKISEWHVAKINAFNVLKNWNISHKENEFLFLFCDFNDYLHMIVINKKSFIKAVNDNLSLFRYLLGRTLTAENLLLELANRPDKFYETIKNNAALLGILLGFGTNNSLLISRLEDLTSPPPDIDAFPFFCSPLLEKPMLGFSSLEEEREVVANMTIGSNSMLDCDSYDIPCFGCEPFSEETVSLLATYKKNRENILEVIEDENFLEKVLEKIFTRTSGEIVLPSSIETPSQLDLKVDMPIQFASVLYEETKNLGLQQEFLLQAFIEGIADQDNEKERFSDSNANLYLCESETIGKNLECCKNLIRTKALFDKVSLKKDWVSLIPQGICYKVLKEGKGSSMTSKVAKATFHYSCRFGWEKRPAVFGTSNGVEVEKLIPGIAQTLIGMKKGEQRILLIHPRYGYGMYTNPSNIPLHVKIEILDFEEGNCETAILPPSPLEPAYCFMLAENNERIPMSKSNLDETDSQKDLLLKYRKLLAKREKLYEWQFYTRGTYFRDSIKRNSLPVDLERLRREIEMCIKAKSSSSDLDKEKFICDFKSHLFILEYQNGIRPSFASWF
jgi:peptidylprolyl isomerase